jgi:predicted nucleic acid-binding protein
LGYLAAADPDIVILVDTNILIYAFDPGSQFYGWSRETLVDALANGGAAINPVILAELCVGDHKPETMEFRLAQLGLHFLDLKTDARVKPRIACHTTFESLIRRQLLPARPGDLGIYELGNAEGYRSAYCANQQ